MRTGILLLFCFFYHCMDAQWLTLKPMPTARQEMPAVLVNRKIYLIGGITSNLLEGLVTKKNEVYDISNNTWKGLKDMTWPRHHAAIAALQNKIYVIGGYDNISFNPVNTVLVYDIQNDSWSRAANLPVKSGSGDAVVFNDKIYFFGGANKQHTLDTALRYDPLTDSWTILQPMPTPREHIAAVLIDTLIYITAGRGSTDAEKLLHIYDPQTNSWTSGANLKTPRSGSDAVTYRRKMYVLGGEGSRAFNEFEEYNPATNLWDSFPRMPHARHGLGCVVLNDTLYTIGGATVPGFAPSSLNEAFVFNSIPTSLSFQKTDRLHAYWIDKNTLFLNMGNTESKVMLTIYSYDGKLIYSDEVALHQPVRVDTRLWYSGLYILSVKINEIDYTTTSFHTK